MKVPPPSEDAALDALFAAARAERPDTSRAEHGFETRLRARLAAGEAVPGAWTEFAGWCWRLVPALTVITLAAVLWTTWLGATLPADDDLVQWLSAEWLPPI